MVGVALVDGLEAEQMGETSPKTSDEGKIPPKAGCEDQTPPEVGQEAGGQDRTPLLCSRPATKTESL